MRQSSYGLWAFVIALAIRATPEVLAGPYPVGFDTVGFYIPNTIDWATGKMPLGRMLGEAPLLYLISVPVYSLSGINPIWIFKVMGPLLYGLMILSLFRFLRRGLRWSSRESLIGGILTSLYFVTLRISWDLYRNMMGMTLILLAIPLLVSPEKKLRNQIILSLLLVGAVASDQLTGVLALSLVGTLAVISLKNRLRDDFGRTIRAATPAGILFSLIFYSWFTRPDGILLVSQPSIPSIQAVSFGVGFLGYVYWPIIPLALLGLTKTRSLELKTWLAFCGFVSLSILVPLYGLAIPASRWILLLDVPLSIFFVSGLIDFSRVKRSNAGIKGLRSTLIPVVLIAFAVSSTLYLASPPQHAFGYFEAYNTIMPTSLLQSTIPPSDVEYLVHLLGWLQTNMNTHSVLIAHVCIYGWARVFLSTSLNIINYLFYDQSIGLQMAHASGYHSVYMIWWTNGSGWCGSPTIAAGFVPVTTEGDLGIYAAM